jgi:predicted amino acid-binding ACT domain protein
MFAIFTSERSLAPYDVNPIKRGGAINVGLKKISQRQARFMPNKRDSFIIRVHGQDKPGIVYRLTQLLAKYKFNITDLSTHRTEGKKAGYVLWLEGELQKKSRLSALTRDLRSLGKKLKIHISAEPVSTVSF